MADKITIPYAITPVWGEAASSQDIVQPADSSITLGWQKSSIPPARQTFNWHQNQTNLMARLTMQRGLPFWRADEFYQQYAVVIAPNGKSYQTVMDTQGNDPTTDDGAHWVRWGLVYEDISPVPVGAIIASHASTLDGFLPCTGSSVSQTTYAALFAIIGPMYGSTSTNFILPDFRNRVLQGPGTRSVGAYASPGLPNITGHINYVTPGANPSNMGAFSVPSTSSSSISGNAASDNWIKNADFNASRSNSIYGAATTVQPPAGIINFFIKY